MIPLSSGPCKNPIVPIIRPPTRRGKGRAAHDDNAYVHSLARNFNGFGHRHVGRRRRGRRCLRHASANTDHVALRNGIGIRGMQLPVFSSLLHE